MRALPKNHQFVLDILTATGPGVHQSAAEVYERARALRPGIGHTTIYRALARLRDEGLAREVAVPGAPAASYEPMGPDHAHFRCVRCGAVSDVDYTLSPQTLDALSAQNGSRFERATFSFEGVCSNCEKGATF